MTGIQLAVLIVSLPMSETIFLMFASDWAGHMMHIAPIPLMHLLLVHVLCNVGMIQYIQIVWRKMVIRYCKLLTFQNSGVSAVERSQVLNVFFNLLSCVHGLLHFLLRF